VLNFAKKVCLENVVDPDKLRQLFQQYTGALNNWLVFW
jgi:hypothetical protein